MLEVLAPVLGVIAIVAAIAGSVIVVRFASAFAKRLEARPHDVALSDPAIPELLQQVDAMQERLDFLERAVVALKNQSPRALPGTGERADRTADKP